MSVHKLGTERLLPGEVNEDLVEALDGLLDRVKRGEITALAWAGITGNEHLFNGWDGSGGTIFTLGASISALGHRYTQFMMDDE